MPPHIMKPLHLFPNRQLVRNQDEKKKNNSTLKFECHGFLVFKTYSVHNRDAIIMNHYTIMNKNKAQININM